MARNRPRSSKRAYNSGNMRRQVSIWAFALFLAVPLWAQRGGGGHAGGFGGHTGFGGSHFGGFAHSGGAIGAGHFSGTMRSGPVRSFGNSRFGVSHDHPFLHDGFHAGFHGSGRFHSFRFRNSCFGWRCGFVTPWWGWGWGSPWLWGWSYDDYSYDQDHNRNLAMANEMNQQSLDQQRMWQQEQQDGDQDDYAPYSSPSRPGARPDRDSDKSSANSSPGTAIVPPTVLVFHDQHREEIENYAIVGQTLWNLAQPGTEKIPLASLDIPATVKANNDRGVIFRVPTLTEGQ